MRLLAMLLAAALAPACRMAPVGDAVAADLALVGGTVWVGPDEPPVRDGVVLVAGDRIAAVGTRSSVPVPRGAVVLDCSGLTVTAGFWNSHVHFLERQWADAARLPAAELGRQLREAFTRYGFTSVFDLSSAWENTRRLRDRIEAGQVPGPRVLSTGEGLVPPGAVPPQPVLDALGFMPVPLPEVADAAQAAAEARRLLAHGVDGIKLFASSPRGSALPDGAMAAVVAEAHGAGRPVFAHPNTGADVLAALRAGVDVIAHTTPGSGPWDEAVLAAVGTRRVALTPTLTLWRHVLRHDRASVREQRVAAAVAQLRAWVAAGGAVLFGTDLGAVDPDPAVEYALMAEAGMSFEQILASLTTEPATRFGGPGERGRIAAGEQGDLVVLRGDPTRDAGALAAVRYTVRAGKVIHRHEP